MLRVLWHLMKQLEVFQETRGLLASSPRTCYWCGRLRDVQIFIKETWRCATILFEEPQKVDTSKSPQRHMALHATVSEAKTKEMHCPVAVHILTYKIIISLFGASAVFSEDNRPVEIFRSQAKSTVTYIYSIIQNNAFSLSLRLGIHSWTCCSSCWFGLCFYTECPFWTARSGIVCICSMVY